MTVNDEVERLTSDYQNQEGLRKGKLVRDRLRVPTRKNLTAQDFLENSRLTTRERLTLGKKNLIRFSNTVGSKTDRIEDRLKKFSKTKITNRQRQGIARFLLPSRIPQAKRVRVQGGKLGSSVPNNQDPRVFSKYYENLKNKELAESIRRNSQLSENTARILADLRRVQNLSKTNDAVQQRRIREKKLLNHEMSLLRTPNIFKETFIDATKEIPELNPLRAENVFKEKPDSINVLRKRKGAFNLLETKEAGNNLKFF